jgi:hypothetical protein
LNAIRPLASAVNQVRQKSSTPNQECSSRHKEARG